MILIFINTEGNPLASSAMEAFEAAVT